MYCIGYCLSFYWELFVLGLLALAAARAQDSMQSLEERIIETLVPTLRWFLFFL